ncbi:FtsX-like permease family protein [Pseudoflavitalea sp. G-6-1-2]|uniref:ABC transporter permease n=1 Tax=Pseudoflavitalea sp. G-6-1-2 TaxID=2728841 RepID=UPI00146F1566|nr:ABC transporter permease [Pseudoflavitalea sp. G-6-1-2]NML21216.1 FtsX-like permease family protein [Pseudoflavitalea sp. G-6-1-2]
MLKSYLKIAWRNLSRNKTYGILNIAGLALSITCGILVFVLVKYHLSFDNFHKDSARIYRFVTEQHRDEVTYSSSVPPAFGATFRNDYSFGEKVARIVSFDKELISIESGKDVKKFKEASGPVFAEKEYFEIFNFPMLKGNQQTALTEPNSAIITERLAKKYFGNDDAMGKVLKVGNKIEVKITGVLKDLPANSDQEAGLFISWPTIARYDNWFSQPDAWGGISSELQCFVRLNENVQPASVEAVLPAYVKKYRPKNKNVHVYKLQPIADWHFDARYGGVMEKKNIWILCFIGLFLIITACVNFVNLATAQALKRSKEVGIKKVLGSLRNTLFWQFIAETAMITTAAAALALGLAYILLPAVNDLFSASVNLNIFQNWQLLLFIPLLILLVTFLAGVYPGMVLSGFRPITALKGKLSMQHIGGFNVRRGLIVAQFSISLVLIISMIVITRQMEYAKKSELGFRKDAIVMLPLGADSMGVAVQTLQHKLADIPGVEKVTACYAAPGSEESWFNMVSFDNRPEPEDFRVNIKAGDDQYLSAFDLKLVAGRNIFPSDSVREAVVNETLVRKLGIKSVEEAIGHKINLNGGKTPASIVGVVKDFHDKSFHEDINPVCITSYTDFYGNYAVRVRPDKLGSVLPQLEAVWSNMYPEKLYESQFLDAKIAAFYETEATMLQLIRVFSFIAIFIGCLGLYGLVAFMVTQKTKEIGIRKVLGSSMREILWIFGKEFALLIVIAFLIAAPLGWWLMHSWLQDFEYHINIGVVEFALAILLIATVTAITVGFQSIKASLMNPVKSLRSE